MKKKVIIASLFLVALVAVSLFVFAKSMHQAPPATGGGQEQLAQNGQTMEPSSEQGGSPTARGQRGGAPSQSSDRAAGQPGRAGGAAGLNLTEKQQTQMKAIREDTHTKMKAILQDTKLSDEEKQKRIRELAAASADNTRKILTPEQQKQREQRRGGVPGEGPRAGGRRGPGGDPMAALNLTEEQKAKAQAIREKFEEQFGKLREDKTLTDDDRRSRMRKIFEEQRSEMMAILTPEQKKKFEELGARRPRREREPAAGDTRKPE